MDLNETFRIKQYNLQNDIAHCIVEQIGCKEVIAVKMVEKRTNLECQSAIEVTKKILPCGTIEYDLEIDMLHPDYSIRSWNIAFILDDKKEYLVEFTVDQADKMRKHRFSLGQIGIFPKINIHLIPAMDADEKFCIRKWKTKSELVKKKPVYMEWISMQETFITFSLEAKYKKEIFESEVWLWSKALKKILRIPVSKEKVQEGQFSIDLEEFIQEYGTTLHRLWEVHLVVNMNGAYYIQRIEDVINKKYEKDRLAEIGNRDSCEVDKKYKEMDETYRFIGGIPIQQVVNDDCIVAKKAAESSKYILSAYYTQELQFACRIVEKRLYYIPQFREKLKSIKIKGSICEIIVECMNSNFNYHSLVLRYRDDLEQKEYPFVLEERKETKEMTVIKAILDLSQVDFKQFYWDIFLVAQKDGFDYEIRPINLTKTFKKKIYNRKYNAYTDKNQEYIYPFITPNENVVLFCRAKSNYDKNYYYWKEKLAIFIYSLIKMKYSKKRVILLYEKFCAMAQDNSYYMFQYYMSDQVPVSIRDNTYYIIDKSQPDFVKLKKYGNHVIEFMSVRHLVYMQAAKLFVSIDLKRHAYQWRGRNSKILDVVEAKPFVFLQHGVASLKKVDYIYKKGGINTANLVVVSSEIENKIFQRWFGYEENEIIVTGLSRWDVLEDKSAGKREILFMPTWRSWILEVSNDEFAKTDYFRHYSELLSSLELDNVLEKNDMELVFCMHPKFRQYINMFHIESKRIKLFTYDSEPINELIMRCSLFITDYSSASWDAFYIKKPVIFYQFDYNKYMELQGSYIDMEKDLFGPRVLECKSLTEEIDKYAENGFLEEEKFSKKREVYLPKPEIGHCKKIFEEIEKRTW